MVTTTIKYPPGEWPFLTKTRVRHQLALYSANRINEFERRCIISRVVLKPGAVQLEYVQFFGRFKRIM